jgi:uncharacterized protein (DUF2252 family)
MSPLEVWYGRLDMESIIREAPDEATRKGRMQSAEKARQRVIEQLFPKIATVVGGRHRLVDQPPVLVHVADADIEERVQYASAVYRRSLPPDRQALLDAYRVEDLALKVLGIGSVGTRCYIVLLFCDGHPLILQVKEARRSVLEPHAGKSPYENQGQRVVMGQRMMQSSDDIFLGWMRGR